MTLDERIDAGRAYLYATFGPDWPAKVDPADIDQEHTSGDIRAQLTGRPVRVGYDGDGVPAFEIDHGFMPADGETFEDLNAAWQKAL